MRRPPAPDHRKVIHVRLTSPIVVAILAALALIGFALLSSPAYPATFQSTAYGPPWGGINGGGVTATGVNLRGAPAVYGVAVDPAVIRLGSKVRAWPNPWGCRRCLFRAFDTGGAIRGRRLDFYHPSRAVQMRWGRRPVTAYVVRVVARAKMRSSAGWSPPPR